MNMEVDTIGNNSAVHIGPSFSSPNFVADTATTVYLLCVPSYFPQGENKWMSAGEFARK